MNKSDDSMKNILKSIRQSHENIKQVSPSNKATISNDHHFQSASKSSKFFNNFENLEKSNHQSIQSSIQTHPLLLKMAKDKEKNIENSSNSHINSKLVKEAEKTNAPKLIENKFVKILRNSPKDDYELQNMQRSSLAVSHHELKEK